MPVTMPVFPSLTIPNVTARNFHRLVKDHGHPTGLRPVETGQNRAPNEHRAKKKKHL